MTYKFKIKGSSTTYYTKREALEVLGEMERAGMSVKPSDIVRVKRKRQKRTISLSTLLEKHGGRTKQGWEGIFTRRPEIREAVENAYDSIMARAESEFADFINPVSTFIRATANSKVTNSKLSNAGRKKTLTTN